MATYSLANERLRALEDIEREIGAILQNAGSGYHEPEGRERARAPCTGAQPRGGAGMGRDPRRQRCEARRGGGGRGRPLGGAGLQVSEQPRPLSAPAGTVILELSKEKTNERLLDRQAAAFTASVQHVEAELSAQIRYLTQVGGGGRAGAHPALCP